MSDFLYLQHDAAISRFSSYTDPDTLGPDKCDLCGEWEEDCESGHGCIRCAHCKRKPGDCTQDCVEGEHYLACPFPSEQCRCAAIKREGAECFTESEVEAAIEAAREARS